MIYSKSHNFIFIHIAKNGGTSIESFLGKYRVHGLKRTNVNEVMSMLPIRRLPDRIVHPPHVDAKWLRARIGADIFDAAYSFAIVRNPFDQMVSRYEYIRKNQRHHAHRDAARLGFADFLKAQRWKNWNFTRTQFSKISDNSGKILLSRIFRFEEFDGILPEVCARVGLEPPLQTPHVNASQRRAYRDYYDAESRTFVETHFRKDLDFFEYGFDC